MIGLALLRVGVQYAAGGAAKMGTPDFGTLAMWGPALVVIVVTLAATFFLRGFLSVAAVLVGLVAGYGVALAMGQVSFEGVGGAAWAAAPVPFKFGFELNWAIILGMCFMAIISTIETVGDTSAICKSGAGRDVTDREVIGATFANGVGSALAGAFGGLPNTTFSQNVGLVAMTGVMSRHVASFGALFLILAGFVPKVGAVVNTIPINVLGGGVVVMFGMVAASGLKMLAEVNWNRRNMVIFAISLSLGFGLQLEPSAFQHMGETMRILLSSGLLPAAFLAVVLNLVLPERLAGD